MNGDDQLSNKNTKYLYNRVRKVDDTDKKRKAIRFTTYSIQKSKHFLILTYRHTEKELGAITYKKL